jgi:hypothetical protein
MNSMVAASASNDDSNLVKSTLEWIANTGINGLGVLPSAEKVAADHLSKTGNVEDAIDSIIAWRTTYAAGTGFITGLGGIAVMPVAIPAGLAASYALGAIVRSELGGYDAVGTEVFIVGMGFNQSWVYSGS